MSRLRCSPRWMAVAALAVCLAPASFGQNLQQSNSSASWAVVASLASAIPARLTLQPATVALSEPLKYAPEDHRKRKKDGGGGAPVPEGGSPLVYLGFAGIVCISAILFSRRRSKLAARHTAS
jgi:hypothetical protein